MEVYCLLYHNDRTLLIPFYLDSGGVPYQLQNRAVRAVAKVRFENTNHAKLLEDLVCFRSFVT